VTVVIVDGTVVATPTLAVVAFVNVTFVELVEVQAYVKPVEAEASNVKLLAPHSAVSERVATEVPP
jgi:hypothetical protein